MAPSDAQGRDCTGAALIQELPRLTEATQSQPGGVFPDEMTGPCGLDYTFGEPPHVVRSWKPSAPGHQVVRSRKRLAPGKFGKLAAAMKQLRALALLVLRDDIAASRSDQYIEMVMRFVVHHPLPNRPKVYPEEHTRPVVLEEEVAKLIVALIVQEIRAWIMSSQCAYMGGGDAVRIFPHFPQLCPHFLGRATSAGRVWQKVLHLHVCTDSSTLWHLLDVGLHVKHPCTVAHISPISRQLRPMNVLRSDSAAFAVRRWFGRAAGSVERGVAQLVNEINTEVIDVTADLRRGGLHEDLSLQRAEWTHRAAGDRVMVYTDTTHHEATQGIRTGVG